MRLCNRKIKFHSKIGIIFLILAISCNFSANAKLIQQKGWNGNIKVSDSLRFFVCNSLKGEKKWLPFDSLGTVYNQKNYFYHGYQLQLVNLADFSTETYLYYDWAYLVWMNSYDKEGNILKNYHFGLLTNKDKNQPSYLFKCAKIVIPPFESRNIDVFFSKEDPKIPDILQIHSYTSLQNQIANSFSQEKYYLIFDILFCSILFFQFLVIGFQWFIQRRVEYVYYNLYLATLFLYFFPKIEVTYPLDIFFSYHIEFVRAASATLSLISQFFYLRFGRFFLNIPRNQKKFIQQYKIIEYTVLFAAFFTFMMGVFNEIMKMNQVFYAFSLIIFMAAIYIMYRIFQIKSPYSYFVLLGSFAAIVGNLLSIIQSIFQFRFWELFTILNYVQAGILVEILVFNVGLLYKSKMLEKEKIQHQENLIRQLTENEKLNKNMQEIRDKISQDLHDDIGATLSSIKIYSEVAQKQWQKSPQQVPKLLQKIYENASQTMDSMSDIVWTINPKRDKAEDLMFKMNIFAHELLDMKEIRFVAEYPLHFEKWKLGMNYRKNIFLIFKEAINNVAKYSQAKEVHLFVKLEKNTLEIHIEDDGIGFEKDEKSMGNGTENMKKRAEEIGGSFEINSAIGKGTKIDIKIPNFRV